MKGIIIYESHYGNTKSIAEAIAAELEAAGHTAQLVNLRDRPAPPFQGDILFLGSPVRFGNTSGWLKKFIEKLDKAYWDGKPAMVFTTILALPPNASEKQMQAQEKYDIGAGRRLRDYAREKGLSTGENTLWVEVKGLKGPLAETGIEKARAFTRETIAASSLKVISVA